jgi:LPS export ABC transporter protein LptC
MNRIAALLVVVVLAAVIWFGITRRGPAPAKAEPTPTDSAAYNFEAQEVVMRQMDATGRLQYEVQAGRVVQLPDGTVRASEVTLHHDPDGAAEGSPRRWTLTATEGELPAEGNVVHLSGNVLARGLPADSTTPLQVSTSQLDYDLSSRLVSSDGEVVITRGCSRIEGRKLRANVATGVVRLESDIHGTIFCP